MFSSYSIITYNLIVLCHLCPKVVNDHFTLVSIINSGFLILVPENSFLIFNIPYTSPKTAMVYFGVLQNQFLNLNNSFKYILSSK